MQASSTLSTRSHAFAWLLLIVAACAGAFWWFWAGRPKALPDAPSSRIACVSYAPFRLPGDTALDPKAVISPERIDADLRVLSQRFDCVRTYSQSHGLDAVPGIAQRYHMKVLLGIWLSRELDVNKREMAMGIATANANPQVVRAVIVGNEVMLRGEMKAQTLADYIHQVRVAIPASIPVTYADVWEYWMRYPQLASAVDYITVHILPYWENDPIPTTEAVHHVIRVYARMQQMFPGKTVMIGETGWPSAGRMRRSSEASVVDEALYLRDFLRYAATSHIPYNVIETFDQPWKRAQEGTVGGYWGIYDVNAKPKFPMTGPVVEETHWLTGWYAGAAGWVLFLIVGAVRRTWRGAPGWVALTLAGIGTGTALAWQVRQMILAANLPIEWAVSIGAIALALLTALWLARESAARFTSTLRVVTSPSWLRFGWLFGFVLYDILMAFDGRQRDFPVGLFAVPCIGFALQGLLSIEAKRPSVEQQFLAWAGPLLAIAIVAEDLGENRVTWLWLGLNLAIGLPVLLATRRANRGLRANQNHAAHQ